MSETTKTMADKDRDMLSRLTVRLERQIARQKGIIKDNMEDLTARFNVNFEWKAEAIYKANIMLDFFVDLWNHLQEEECNIDKIRFYLRHAVEHASYDIMHRDPYSSSSNSAVNLAHRWTYETYKVIYHQANNLLDILTPDDNE